MPWGEKGVMLKARPDRKNPKASSGAKLATMIGSRSADRIRAAAICAANAAHMTAPARTITLKKPLQRGSHPHMRFKPLKRLDLILSLSKDGDAFSGFFSSPLGCLLSRPPGIYS
jgi:hypothetical protein